MVDDRTEEGPVEPALVEIKPELPGGWLEAAYQEHSRTVLQAAYRVTGNPQDAEDVLQTVFMRLARSERAPDFSTGSGPYLRRAATNAALDIVQSRRVRSGVSLEANGSPAVEDPRPAADRLQFGREVHDLLRQALAEMTRRNAEMFVLRYFEGFSNNEIAEILDTSPGTVAVTLHRVRERLKAELAVHVGGMS